MTQNIADLYQLLDASKPIISIFEKNWELLEEINSIQCTFYGRANPKGSRTFVSCYGCV